MYVVYFEGIFLRREKIRVSTLKCLNSAMYEGDFVDVSVSGHFK